MEASAIKQEMLQYFNRLNNAEQKSILQLIKTFVESHNNEFVPVTLEQYNKELEEADKEIESGDYITHDEVKKMFSK